MNTRNRGSHFAICTVSVFVLNGCRPSPCPVVPQDRTIHVVLTFDDGPIAADIVDARSVGSSELLLPLERILEALDTWEASAVFYVRGPGSNASEASTTTAFGDGVSAIYARGHFLGFHAFDHLSPAWSPGAADPQHVAQWIAQDLDRLEAFVLYTLRERGFTPTQVFSPVFRQPYGGFGVQQVLARQAAIARGWVYHGYAIDSLDWLKHADADPALAAALGAITPQAHAALVRDTLLKRAAALNDEAIVDVLFHVNELTAANLTAWLAALEEAFAAAGRTVIFDVPACYLETDDPRIDLSHLPQILTAAG